MRVFLAALLVSGVLAGVSIFALDIAQRTSGTAYTTGGARIDPAWAGAS